ncbi:MAG: tetratricopeptide repeat protein, partial [Pirellulales bacterium]
FEKLSFQIQIAMIRQDYATARTLLGKANKLKPNNLQVYLSGVSIARLDPSIGPAKAMEMWERVAKDFGDSAEMRLAKADILIAQSGEQLKPELASLLVGVDGWKPEQKILLWGGMAQRYLNLGMTDEAKEYLALVADARPNELPTRVGLFTLALETNDDEGMQAAQKKILEIVRNQHDSTYLYTEARRRLSQVRRGKLGPEALPGIRELINRALESRPDWHELWVIDGELELYANNPVLALKHYAKAEKLGRPNPRSVAQHIRLLALFGRYREAGELLDRIPESSRQQLLDNAYTEILFRTNKVDDAIREARAAAEAAPTDPNKQFWYGQLLARSAQMPDLTDQQRKAKATEAIAALRRAVELEPELPDAWYALITLNAMQANAAGAEQALRDAQLSLAGNNLQLFLAKSYEALGHWFDAETMYRAVYEMDPKDPRRAQQLAAFYVSPVYQQPDRQEKVTPLLNQILRAGQEVGADNKKVLPPNDGTLLWARRTAAQMLASTGDYQNLLKAENLLASSSQEGTLPVEDRLQMAQILASRPEPESRKKAAGLLKEVSDLQPLNETGELTLGQLYYVMGEWSKCQSQMLKAIGRFPQSTTARESYIDMLLSRNDPRYYQEASKQLEKLREFAPGGRGTFALTVKLANKQGKQQAVRAELLRRMPKLDDPSKITDEQAQFLAFLASLFIELDDLENAERLFQALAQRDSKLQFPLADFLGAHRDVGKCFDLLAQLYSPSSVNDVLTVGINTLRARRDEVGTKYDSQVEQWLSRAKLENPDSISVQMLEADFYDVQEKYDDAADIYRKLLARSDLDGFRRAVVLNNLSFLVALAGSSADASDLDPLKLVQEAEQILGPNADILDTKAVVLIERQRYKEAIDELKLSVTDKPTGAKYFHLVVAHLGAGENRAALQAWEKAEAQGLTRDALNRLEHSRFDEVKAKIDQLRNGSSSVSRNEPVRQSP